MAFYLFSVSYALMAFWITMMLAVMYSLLGRLSGEILVLRFVDTVVGVVIGLLISAFVLPAKTSDKVKDCAVDFLKAFKEYVCDCAERLAGDAPATPPLRDLDDKLQTVTQTADIIRRG